MFNFVIPRCRAAVFIVAHHTATLRLDGRHFPTSFCCLLCLLLVALSCPSCFVLELFSLAPKIRNWGKKSERAFFSNCADWRAAANNPTANYCSEALLMFHVLADDGVCVIALKKFHSSTFCFYRPTDLQLLGGSVLACNSWGSVWGTFSSTQTQSKCIWITVAEAGARIQLLRHCSPIVGELHSELAMACGCDKDIVCFMTKSDFGAAIAQTIFRRRNSSPTLVFVISGSTTANDDRTKTTSSDKVTKRMDASSYHLIWFQPLSREYFSRLQIFVGIDLGSFHMQII